MASENRILLNTTYLVAGNFALRLITASTAILLARHLSAEEYGLLSVALALAAIAGFLSKMSLNHTMIREGMLPDVDISRLVGGALKLRIIFSLAATVIFAGFIKAAYSDPLLCAVAYAVVLPSIWGGSLLSIGEVCYQIEQRMQYTAILKAVPGVVTALFLIIGILSGWNLLMLAMAYGVAALTSGLIGLVVIFRKTPNLGGWHAGLLNGLASFALGGVLTLVIGQLGPLALERTTDLVQVGYFAVAFRVPALLYTFPGALAAAFYPKLFYFGSRDVSQHLALCLSEIKYMSLMGTIMALPFALYPEWIIGLLFGAKWAVTASQALAIMIWVVILQSFNYPLADALATRGFQQRRTAVLSVAILFGAGLYFYLGSRWGAVGGAAAAVAIEAIQLVGFVLANPARKQLLRHSLLPQGVLVLVALLWGRLIKIVAPNEILGFALVPLTLAGLLFIFDREIRERILALSILKERFGAPASVRNRTGI